MKTPADPFLLRGLHQPDNESPLGDLATITAPEFIETFNHGDLPDWLATLGSLPALTPSSIDLENQVRIGSSADANDLATELEQTLRKFIPWRKGPFNLFGVQIETEWHSGIGFVQSLSS